MTPADAIRTILAAPSPAALFAGDDPHGTYRRLARLVHPDVTTEPLAGRAFAKLAALWRAAPEAATIAGPRRAYAIDSVLAEGDLATLYRVTWDEGVRHAGVAKILRNPANRDLADAELAALRRFADRVDPHARAFLPALADAFGLGEATTGIVRPVVVTSALEPGFVSLAHVAAVYPAGLDARDAAWIFRRMLAALGAAHGAGVVHGAVIPEHVLLHPVLHGVVLVDWCYSSLEPVAPLAATVPRRLALYPADLLAKGPVSPATDLYMAARTIQTVLAADAPRAVRRFLAGCTLARPAARPDDALALLAEFDDCIDRLWPRAYRPLSLPPEGAADPRHM